MGRAGDLSVQNRLDVMDLLRRYRTGQVVSPDKTQHSGSSKHGDARFEFQRDIYKQVARKKRYFDFHPAIAPFAGFGKRRQESRNTLATELDLYFFFVSRSGMHGVPKRTFNGCILSALNAELQCGHSFAL